MIDVSNLQGKVKSKNKNKNGWPKMNLQTIHFIILIYTEQLPTKTI